MTLKAILYHSANGRRFYEIRDESVKDGCMSSGNAFPYMYDELLDGSDPAYWTEYYDDKKIAMRRRRLPPSARRIIGLINDAVSKCKNQIQ